MAKRPVFLTESYAPYYRTVMVEFVWNKGLATIQRQKNISAIHNALHRVMPERRILEISGKSMQEEGRELSAFSIKKYVPSLGKSLPVECIYQAGKVFQKGGPYTDLLEADPMDAKRDERLKNSGGITEFVFEGKRFPTYPRGFFYNYLYINALLENSELAQSVQNYDTFTDIVFNPEKSVSCQANAAAIFVSLARQGLLDQAKDPDMLLALLQRTPAVPKKKSSGAERAVPEKKTEKVLKVGALIRHPKFGEGRVIAAEPGSSSIQVEFRKEGIKTLGLDWCLARCEMVS